MQVFDESYTNTVNAIIAREGRASQAEWSQRPVFSTPAAPRLAPPPPRTLSAPPSRISVGELRRARAARASLRRALPAGRRGCHGALAAVTRRPRRS